jgi:hypothetical protein
MFVLTMLVLASVGCGGVDPGTNPVPRTTFLSVTIGGKPADDIKFNLQPVGNALPAAIDIKDGEAEFEMTPGEYTYFISAGKSEAAFKQVPEKYHAGSMDRKFTVQGGEKLEFKLD